MKNLIYLLFLGFGLGIAQAQTYTRADTLRGSLRPERTDYDVLKYDLWVEVQIADRYISGYNEIVFQVLHKMPVMQLDLFQNMHIDSILFRGQQLKYRREYNAVFISFPQALDSGETDSLRFYYSGHPKIAKNPPWDGGFIFTQDENGKPWVSVAVQGTGASLWYPCKDTQSDEPEEAEIHVTTPAGLMNVSNGRLTGKKEKPRERVTWSWKVVNPINSYNLVLNIGDYVHFSDHFRELDLNYYVLPYHLEEAKKEFQEVKAMLRCFTDKFGDYPFKEDGYKLIETPYLGMEHQSAIGYGNAYQKGYLGKDLSQTGVGLKWDFIIVHESAHEWFGNSITAADLADMWIHEAFASYAEAVYVECRWGKKAALTYLRGLRKTRIANKAPIIGDYGVNDQGSGDMYYKGANMLQTLRAVVDDDQKWWRILKKFALTFKHRITNTAEVVHYFSKHIDNMDVEAFFDQYLRYSHIPVLQMKSYHGHVVYRWEARSVGFNMPIEVQIAGQKMRLHPSKYWQELDESIKLQDIKVNTADFYVRTKKYRR